MQIVFMFLFACVFAVSAHWSSEQRERDFERKRDHELKMWGDKKWDKKSWVSQNPFIIIVYNIQSSNKYNLHIYVDKMASQIYTKGFNHYFHLHRRLGMEK